MVSYLSFNVRRVRVGWELDPEGTLVLMEFSLQAVKIERTYGV